MGRATTRIMCRIDSLRFTFIHFLATVRMLFGLYKYQFTP